MTVAERQGALSRFWSWARGPKDLALSAKGKSIGVSGAPYDRRLKKIVPTYNEMVQRYLAQPRLKCSIDEITEISAGCGFYVTCNNSYEAAMELVNDFNEDVDLDTLNTEVARDLWITGNAIIWKQKPNELKDLVRIPINSITHIKATRTGTVTALKQDLKGGDVVKVESNKLNELILLRWNPIDTGIIGRGLMEPIVRQGYGYKYKTPSGEWKTAYRPSYGEIIEEVEDMMRTQIIRYTPRFVYELMGFTADEADDFTNNINQMTWLDDIILHYTNKEDRGFLPHRLTTDPRSRLDPFVGHFRDGSLIAMETPAVKLLSETGFTEASSRTAERIEMRKVAAFQRFFKRRIEREIFRPVLQQQWKPEGNAVGPAMIKLANVRLNWNDPTKPTITPEFLLKALELNAITSDEFRKNISKWGVELIEQVSMAEKVSVNR